MKKQNSLLTILAILLIFALPAVTWADDNNGLSGNITVKVGVDTAGKIKAKSDTLDKNYDVTAAPSIGAEYTYFYNNLGVGGGIMAQLSRKVKDQDGSFWWLPIYGLLKYQMPSGDWTPYVIGQLGYSAYYGNTAYKGSDSLTGGLYWGIGLGTMWMKNWQLEVLYNQSKGRHAQGTSTGSLYTTTSTGTGTGTGGGYYDFDVTAHTVGISLGYAFAL